MFSVSYRFVIVLQCDDFVVFVLSDKPRQNQGRGLVDRKLVKAPPPTPSNFIAGRLKRLFCFGSLKATYTCMKYDYNWLGAFLRRYLKLSNYC